MQKFILATLTSCLFLPAAQALSPYGFYIGGDGTATSWEFEISNDFPSDTSNNMSYDRDQWDYSALIRAGVYALWGNDQRWLTAIDFLGQPHAVRINYDQGSLSDDVGVDVIQQQIEVTYSLGAELKQGRFVHENILFFVTAGLLYTQYKTLSNINFNFENEDDIQEFTQDKFYLPGYRFGLGMELLLSENVSTTLQTTYTVYEEKHLISPEQNISINPRALALGAGVNFYF